MSDPRRALPSVDRLLHDPAVVELLTLVPRDAVVAAVREALDAARVRRAGPPDDWGADIRDRLAARSIHSLRPVLNATGVVLHTNLGRAPLAAEALAAVTEMAGGYANLEYDVARGMRGSRYVHCAALLC